MRKLLSLILCLCLAAGLLAGCTEEESESPTLPPRTNFSQATEAPEETAEPTVPATEAPMQTVALRDRDIALRKTYVLVPIATNAPFLAQGVKLNEAGANALAQWMMTADTQALIENVGLREFGEPIFSLPTDNLLFAGKIAAATPASKTIRLAVESTILDSGLTDELLPTFQQAYQYEVTVTQGPAAAVLNAARSGYADLILLEAGDPVTTLVTEGFARTVPGLMGEQLRICSMQYLLCGPREDPAKVADWASVGESFAAIAAGEFRFTCPGDGSPAHRLAHQFWPASTQFGSWYVDADMAMGPSLVMSDIEGGYILTDKLTWLIFSQADGII